MKHADKWFLYAVIGALSLLFGAMTLVSARPAAAQCGTSASSCKNCHETQGVMPVNNSGDWHKAHAFGDFCEFCHAGNVQATAKEEAHRGMVAPLADLQAGCQGCHPNDYNQLAEQYASTLGVELLAAGGSPPAVSSDSSGEGDGCAPGVTSVSAPLGGEEIDFNLLYAEATAPPPLISNWGNLILLVLIAGVSAAFFVTAWSWENWGQAVAAWFDRHINPIPQALTAAALRTGPEPATLSAEVMQRLAQQPELQRLLSRLLTLPPETLAALDTILADPERGSDIITAISRVDAELVATLRQLGAKDRHLLAALIKGI